MTLIKAILYYTLLSLFLVSCAGADPTPTGPSNSTPAVEIMPPTNTPLSPPVQTLETTIAMTVEPTPETEEIDPSPTATPSPPTKSEQAQAQFQPTEETVSITGAEGLAIRATLYTPGGSEPAPGVILLHMLGSSRQVWTDNGLAEELVGNGYAVLTVDMRGHGETGGSPNWPLAVEDLQLVWDYFSALDAVDPHHTAVIGASIGANLALQIGAGQPAIQTVILLSPGLDYRGVVTAEPLEAYGSRPILVVASEEDTYAADSSRTLDSLAPGESQLELYNGAGHGTNMFTAQSELTPLILTWLNQYLN